MRGDFGHRVARALRELNATDRLSKHAKAVLDSLTDELKMAPLAAVGLRITSSRNAFTYRRTP